MDVNSLILSYLFLLTLHTTLSNILVYNNSNKVLEDLDDEEGSFTPSLPSDGIQGYIITTDPPNGCSKISPPPNIPTFGYQWIALIQRTPAPGPDSCEFTLKIQNAYNANFSGVIVYNYEDKYISMGPYGKDVGIPSTFITKHDGLLLIQNYIYNVTSVNSTPIYHVKIMPDEPYKFGPYLIPFILVISVFFFGLICYMLIKCCLQRRRLRRHRLPRSALRQLKTKKYVKSDPWDVCAICLDDYEDGAKLRILPCDHAYHMKCIDPWLLNNRRQCPVCKRYVFPNQDHSDEEETNDRQQTRTATEQTPLMNPNDNNSGTDISRNRQLPERQLVNPSGSGVPNASYASNESSDDDKDLSLSSGPATTAELIFERSSSNPRRYGSMHNSTTTTRAANFAVGSLGEITDNTNVSIHSVIEDVSDIETTDNDDDERMHSVIYGASEENPAYVNNEQSTNRNQTYL